MRWFAGFFVLNLGLVGAAYAMLWMTGAFEDSGLSVHGWIALCLGTTVASLLGIGLMGLVFYSNRQRVDDLVNRTAEKQE
jgi:hypothetical protein